MVCGFPFQITVIEKRWLATITQLRARKQRYKLKMFERLYYILLLTIVVIAIFFVVSSLSFSGRLAEGQIEDERFCQPLLTLSLRLRRQVMARSVVVTRWMACSSLFIRVCCYRIPVETVRQQPQISEPLGVIFIILIDYLTLAMSDEIAQDEEDAEDYDLESMGPRDRVRDDDDDDNATLVGGRRGIANDHVVFEIGDEDAGSDDEDEAPKKRQGERLSGDNHGGRPEERQGLMSEDTQSRTRTD